MMHLDAIYALSVARFPDAVELTACLLNDGTKTDKNITLGMHHWEYWKGILQVTLDAEHTIAYEFELSSKGYAIVGRQNLALPRNIPIRDKVAHAGTSDENPKVC